MSQPAEETRVDRAAPVAVAAAPHHSGPMSFGQKVKAFRHKYETFEHVGFFLGGFTFDLFMLERIDSLATLGQQGLYLFLIGALMLLEQRHALGLMKPKGIFAKAWSLSEGLMHFFLGTLLSNYTIFYFKSAAGISGLLFMVGLAALLVGNDLPKVRKLGPVVRFALYSLCLSSYFAYFFPVIFGIVRWYLFVLAVLVSSGITVLMYRWVKQWAERNPSAVTPQSAKYPALAENIRSNRILIPAMVAQGLFLALYFAKAIPPVPLAATYIGIFHDVKRAGGGAYELSYEDQGWKFWHKGDQTFHARAGDKIFVFARVFAPKKFSDNIYARWSFDDPKRGWVSSDKVRLGISGGKEEGFATWSTKQNYQPGNWRVELQTEDDRTVGMISFNVEADDRPERPPFLVKIDKHEERAAKD
ncbi:MAG: DUF2914 domain-containing protein [Myxococcaceae bacterium]